MKKVFLAAAMCAVLLLGVVTGCANPTAAPSGSQGANATPTTAQPKEVAVTDSDGKEVSVTQSPKKVAIYDYSILDILYNVGFEKTGITQLIVPAKDNLPADLSYYKEAGNDKVVSGGSLFYVDWDVMDLVQPDLVITGARSFGVNAAGDSLSADDKEKYITDTLARYPEADFIKLTVNTKNAQLVTDMEHNVAVLAEIFPEIKAELEAKLAEIKGDIAEIKTKAAASGKKALFAMMVDQSTLSIFNPDSRFDMLYDDFGFAPVDSGAVKWDDQHGFNVRAEYVLEKNPDVIFLLDRSATVGTGAGAENFMNDAIIKETNAAKTGNIYTLTGDAWYTMTGGFSSAERMIADINQFISKLG